MCGAPDTARALSTVAVSTSIGLVAPPDTLPIAYSPPPGASASAIGSGETSPGPIVHALTAATPAQATARIAAAALLPAGGGFRITGRLGLGDLRPHLLEERV